MEACHTLLGRPWQYDRKYSHDGFTNEITLLHKEKKYVLHPFSLTQVVKDQIQLEVKGRKKKKKKKSLKTQK